MIPSHLFRLGAALLAGALLLAAAACDGSDPATDCGPHDAGPRADTAPAPDSRPPATPGTPWGRAVRVAAFSGGIYDEPALPADGREIYANKLHAVAIVRSPWLGSAAGFGVPTVVPELNVAGAKHESPVISLDGLTLYFASDRKDPKALGDLDIFVATRSSRTARWGTPVIVPALSSPALDFAGGGTADGRVIVFASRRDGGKGGLDLYMATRASATAAWGKPAPLAELNSPQGDSNPWLSGDGLIIYFGSDRATGKGIGDLYYATRPSRSARFSAPRPVPGAGINTKANEEDPWLTPDLRTLYFSSNREGNDKIGIFVAQR